MPHEPVRFPLRNGFTQKSGVGGLIFHSDKGSQYAAHETRNYLQSMGYRQSMSGKGNCFDNAPMESRSHSEHSLKVEETHGQGFETREEAKRCVFGYIEGFYNTTRMHSALNWQSPREFRRAFEQSELEKHEERDFSGSLSTGRIGVASPTSQTRMRPVGSDSGKSGIHATSFVADAKKTVLPRY